MGSCFSIRGEKADNKNEYGSSQIEIIKMKTRSKSYSDNRAIIYNNYEDSLKTTNKKRRTEPKSRSNYSSTSFSSSYSNSSHTNYYDNRQKR